MDLLLRSGSAGVACGCGLTVVLGRIVYVGIHGNAVYNSVVAILWMSRV